MRRAAAGPAGPPPGGRWAPVLLLCGLLSWTAGYVNHEPCPKYGCPLAPPIHEPFVPAPPGYTPKCAKPGLTFCESPDQYPRELIKFLIEKRTVDVENFLRDESSEDFNAFRQMPNYEDEDDEQGYDYPKPKRPPPELYPQSTRLSPPPQPGIHYNVPLNATNNRYLPASPHANAPFLSRGVSVSTQQSHSYQLPSAQLHPHRYLGAEVFAASERGPRPVGSSRGAGFTPRQNPLLEPGAAGRAAGPGRARRQAAPSAVSICPTRARFVSPRAALNDRGNWMFVVNLQEQRKYSQQVKSEVCTSASCDGLCALPLGYSSRCQQQYVQKRLVALEGSGDRLYADVFWFPHGCACQVSLDP